MAMQKIVKVLSTLRKHWKKSTAFTGALAYGVNYGKDQHEIDLFMTKLCEEAANYGAKQFTNDESMKHICVILNPAANSRSARKYFEKFCYPILNLSGGYVTVLESKSEGDARRLVNQIDPKTNVLVVAGGDGTLLEALTGLMRAHGDIRNIPVGIIPLGRYNTLVNSLSPESAELPDAVKIGKASMAIVKGNTTLINSYRVEPLDVNGSDKSVFGVGLFEWGNWPSFKKRLKQVWFMGSFGKYYALLFPNSDIRNASIQAKIRFSKPCSGCSNCVSVRPDLQNSVPVVPIRWWSGFVKRVPDKPGKDYSKILNNDCSKICEMNIKTTDLRLYPEVLSGNEETPPKLNLVIGPPSRYQGEFFKDGIKYLKNETITSEQIFELKQIEIYPVTEETDNENKDHEKKQLLIDNEEFTLRPVKITVLPKSVTIFC